MFFRRATVDLISLPGKFLNMEDLNKQPLTEHLTELRSCLITSLVAVGVGFSVSYYFVQDIGVWFLKPLFDVLPEDSSLIFTSYQEAFFFI
jgi:Sec-independent protein secretion pathway component TatC